MKAIWADGPRRCELVTLRTPHVVLDDYAGAPWWIDHPEDTDPSGTHRPRTVYSVTIVRVGHRAFRVLMPPERSEHMAVLALIDTDPALVRQVEVSP